MIAGYEKLHDIPGFIAEVQKFGILPREFATVFGILLPYLEIGFGGLFLLGMWSVLAATVLSLLLCSYIYAYGVFVGQGYIFNKDIVLLAAALCTLYTGAGALSIDRFRTKA